MLYVTRDIERALGIPPKDGYFIISNMTGYSTSVSTTYKDNVQLIESFKKHPIELLDTYDLLNHKATIETINKLQPSIVVFKNTPQIEKKCRENGWKLLNPNASLAEKVENKISQIEWLQDIASYLPPYEVTECKNLNWDGEPFIVQFNRSHTGEGTIFIDEEKKLLDLQDQFPDRQIKRVAYIPGPVYTSNIIVGKDSLCYGNISYQITGIPPFTERPFSTIGNDWGLPIKTMSVGQKEKYDAISQAVAQKMQRDGWRGLFGIDIKIDKRNGDVYLLEINARQPASTTYESELQSQKRKRTKEKGITTFEAHLAALLDLPITENIISLETGSQIIQRITHKFTKVPDISTLTEKGLNVIMYENSKSNADLIRIQSAESVMADSERLNYLGQNIATILSS